MTRDDGGAEDYHPVERLRSHHLNSVESGLHRSWVGALKGGREKLSSEKA